MSELTSLYALHKRGELAHDDPRWGDVQEEINRVVKDVVSKSARNLYGEPLVACIDDVELAILRKFVEKRLEHRGDAIDPLIRWSARNDMLSHFRRSRSPCAVSFDGAEKAWEHQDEQRDEPGDDAEPDLFDRVRAAMPPFRFQEHPFVRDGILAFFLTHHNYPGPGYLHAFGVHHSVRPSVYNAALFDVNSAMIQLCEA